MTSEQFWHTLMWFLIAFVVGLIAKSLEFFKGVPQ